MLCFENVNILYEAMHNRNCRRHYNQCTLLRRTTRHVIITVLLSWMGWLIPFPLFCVEMPEAATTQAPTQHVLNFPDFN